MINEKVWQQDLCKRQIYYSQKGDSCIKIYNNSEFSFKENGQLVYDLAERRRLYCLVLNSGVFDFMS